jgi:hypothetical protein
VRVLETSSKAVSSMMAPVMLLSIVASLAAATPM